MIDVFTWAKNWPNLNRPFLILGKGPSYSLRDTIDASGYNLVSLNHVVREEKVDIAHIIDIDVVEDCADILDKHADWLLMPLVPHVGLKPTALRLADFVNTIPVLEKYDKENRLLWYPLWSGSKVNGMPAVTGTFSGSVVVNLLAKLGVREIKSLGVDGGYSYSDSFSDLDETTLLKAGHDNYDKQHSEIQETVDAAGISYEPVMNPIRIFVGCDDSQMLAARVLEYSIRKHTKHPVQLFYMRNMPTPSPADRKNRPGTGFSFNRFIIPKLCGYSGKAIYLDADMLVFDDISKLWNMPLNGKKVLCTTQDDVPDGWQDDGNTDLGSKDRRWTPGRQLSVMLLDCSRLDWDVDDIVRRLDRGDYSYKELMARLCIVDDRDIGDTIPNEWNSLEWYEEERTKLVHFTVVSNQPWRNDNNKLRTLWEDIFMEAVGKGVIHIDEVKAAANKSYVKLRLVELAEKAGANADTRQPAEYGLSFGETELEKLRHMLWASMIEAYEAKNELSSIKLSPLYWIELYAIRKPARFLVRVARGVMRRLKLLVAW